MKRTWYGEEVDDSISKVLIPCIGHWIVYKDCEGKTRRCKCDRFGYETGDYTWTNPNFCAECGAKMEGEVKE